MDQSTRVERGFTAKIVEVFITSKLSLLLLIASFLAGFAALVLTPREEEPQIVVPVADVLISVPGASAEEVESWSPPRLSPCLERWMELNMFTQRHEKMKRW